MYHNQGSPHQCAFQNVGVSHFIVVSFSNVKCKVTFQVGNISKIFTTEITFLILFKCAL